MNRYTFKVYPKGMGRNIYRVFLMDGNKTLDDLCSFILDAFDFDHDHLYEFNMNNKMYSEDSYKVPVDDDDFEQPSTEITLDELGLEEKQRFLFHYDFGDDWQFTVFVKTIITVSETSGSELVTSKGELEQY